MKAAIILVPDMDTQNRLNAWTNGELERDLGGTQADYDGEAYHFHLTLAIGQPLTERYGQMIIDLQRMEYDEFITFSHTALYLYQPLLDGSWEYGTYKTLPLNSIKK